MPKIDMQKFKDEIRKEEAEREKRRNNLFFR